MVGPGSMESKMTIAINRMSSAQSMIMTDSINMDSDRDKYLPSPREEDEKRQPTTWKEVKDSNQSPQNTTKLSMIN